jgi:hypothetical protein
MKNQKNVDNAIPFQVILKDEFIDNRHGWELTNSNTEIAALTDQGYSLENKDIDSWHHFSLFPKVDSLKNLLIQCRIEIDSKAGPGQCGIIWGFDSKLRRLNRFCFSTKGRGCTVMHYEKNHRPVFHRFYDPFFNIDTSKPILLEIRESNDYWFFRINKQLVYIAHQIHFAEKGNGIGFYLDPGVSIRVKKLQVSQKGLSKAFSLN